MQLAPEKCILIVTPAAAHKISYNPYVKLSSRVDINCIRVSTLVVVSLVANMQLKSIRPAYGCNSGNGHTIGSQKIKNKNESGDIEDKL